MSNDLENFEHQIQLWHQGTLSRMELLSFAAEACALNPEITGKICELLDGDEDLVFIKNELLEMLGEKNQDRSG